MGIGVQGEPSAEVSQHPGYRFHVYPVLEGQGGKGVAQIVESDPRESRPFQHRWSICSTLSGKIGTPVGLGNTQELLPVFFLCASRTPIVSSASGRVR